jgi:mannitol/fructose-specific phosphotransferase system IIA component (Ntr-type)
MFSEPAVVLGICPKGTNFEAVDDQLVHLFFLICATRDEIHLRLMAKVSWLAKQDDVLNKLNQISSEHEIINFIAAASAKIDSISADKKFHGANSENKQV